MTFPGGWGLDGGAGAGAVCVDAGEEGGMVCARTGMTAIPVASVSQAPA